MIVKYESVHNLWIFELKVHILESLTYFPPGIVRQAQAECIDSNKLGSKVLQAWVVFATPFSLPYWFYQHFCGGQLQSGNSGILLHGWWPSMACFISPGFGSESARADAADSDGRDSLVGNRMCFYFLLHFFPGLDFKARKLWNL